MKKIALAALTLTLSSGLHAAQYGVGVNLNGDSDVINVPININNNLRVEPFVSYYSYAYDVSNSTTGVDYEGYSIGTGVYKINHVTENTNVLIGGRVSYFEESQKDMASSNDYHDRGYTLAPVLGFEYYPVKNMSVGADVALEYWENNGTSNVGNNAGAKGTETTSQITLKYYFN